MMGKILARLDRLEAQEPPTAQEGKEGTKENELRSRNPLEKGNLQKGNPQKGKALKSVVKYLVAAFRLTVVVGIY